MRDFYGMFIDYGLLSGIKFLNLQFAKMKLRRCSASQQLLFLVACCLLAVVPARAQETIITRDGKTQDVKIIGANGTSVQVKVGAGMVGIPLGSISQVNMAPPAEFAAAVEATESKDYAKALSLLKTLTGKYKGLPTDWARQATLMLGDVSVSKNDLAQGEEAYKEYKKLYPDQSSTQLDVCMARLAVAKKDYAAAREKLEPIAAQALKEKSVSKTNAAIYSQVFYLLGQVKEAGGDYSGALQDYLLTVTLFCQDRPAVSGAQERADALRKAHTGLVAP